jgi:hypothetical protein
MSYWYFTKPLNPRDNINLQEVSGKDFVGTTIVLDGKRFSKCTFDKVRFVFNGNYGFEFQRCDFFDTPKIEFRKYAGQTSIMLNALYKDPAFRPFIDRFFQDIKSDDPNFIHKDTEDF